MERSKRLGIVYLDEADIAAILNWRSAPGGEYLSLDSTDLPADVQVERVFHSPERRALGLVVSHDSFEEVDLCCELPVVGRTGRIVLEKVAANDVRVVSHFGQPVIGRVAAEIEDFTRKKMELDQPFEASGDWFRRVMGTP